jgi:hypothetical protein
LRPPEEKPTIDGEELARDEVSALDQPHDRPFAESSLWIRS